MEVCVCVHDFIFLFTSCKLIKFSWVYSLCLDLYMCMRASFSMCMNLSAFLSVYLIVCVYFYARVCVTDSNIFHSHPVSQYYSYETISWLLFCSPNFVRIRTCLCLHVYVFISICECAPICHHVLSRVCIFVCSIKISFILML